MALFEIAKGNADSLPSTKKQGYMYVLKDSKDVYVDVDDNTRVYLNPQKDYAMSSGKKAILNKPTKLSDFINDIIETEDGDDGTSTILSNVTATVDSGTGTPSVDITMGGTQQNRTLNFAFHNLKGAKGADGSGSGTNATISTITATVGTTEYSATSGTWKCTGTMSGTATNRTFNFAFDGIKGPTGAAGTLATVSALTCYNTDAPYYNASYPNGRITYGTSKMTGLMNTFSPSVTFDYFKGAPGANGNAAPAPYYRAGGTWGLSSCIFYSRYTDPATDTTTFNNFTNATVNSDYTTTVDNVINNNNVAKTGRIGIGVALAGKFYHQCHYPYVVTLNWTGTYSLSQGSSGRLTIDAQFPDLTQSIAAILTVTNNGTGSRYPRMTITGYRIRQLGKQVRLFFAQNATSGNSSSLTNITIRLLVASGINNQPTQDTAAGYFGW